MSFSFVFTADWCWIKLSIMGTIQLWNCWSDLFHNWIVPISNNLHQCCWSNGVLIKLSPLRIIARSRKQNKRNRVGLVQSWFFPFIPRTVFTWTALIRQGPRLSFWCYAMLYYAGQQCYLALISLSPQVVLSQPRTSNKLKYYSAQNAERYLHTKRQKDLGHD